MIPPLPVSKLSRLAWVAPDLYWRSDEGVWHVLICLLGLEEETDADHGVPGDLRKRRPTARACQLRVRSSRDRPGAGSGLLLSRHACATAYARSWWACY